LEPVIVWPRTLVGHKADFPEDSPENRGFWRHTHCDAQSVVISPQGRSLFGTATLIAFVIAQLCDGMLTYVGVHTFGQSIEANPILSWYIAALGAGVALLAAKSLAIACALLLYRFALYGTIGVLTVLYFAMAVQPWVSLLILAR
jgi:hypothetical protein